MSIFERRTADGMEWLWPAKDEWGWLHPLEQWPRLREAILTVTPERRFALQAGGCCGMYPRFLAKDFASVLTFEPDPLNFFCLTDNCSSAPVIKLQCALGRLPSFGTMAPGPENNVGLGKVIPGMGTVPILRIDGFRFQHLDLIQLDCEGREFDVVIGALKTIKEHSPTISVENPGRDLLRLLQDLGYERSVIVGSLDTTVQDHVFHARR